MPHLEQLASYSLALLVVIAWLAPAAAAQDEYQRQRERLVTEEIEAAGVTDPRVLASMRSTPRHEFIPEKQRQYAYLDAALPIGSRQTISPPFVVAYMTEQLRPEPEEKVLEIGTGSGYQAAVLSPLVAEVYTIEIVDRLAKRAERTLRRLGYRNVHVKSGDGFLGWPEHAPFDKIIVTCSPESIPQPLVDQLRERGEMIIPVGERYQQNLFRVVKRDGRLERTPLQATLFVPMTGAAEDNRERLPDPANPSIVNGDFNRVLTDTALPTGWHYLRNAAVVEKGVGRGEGGPYLRFKVETINDPGRALQGMALDGRQIDQVRLSARVRGSGITRPADSNSGPAVVITFYDRRRAVIGSERIGPWGRDFEWQSVDRTLDVPLATREAIVRVGLLGAAGVLDIDDVSLAVVQKSP